MCPGCRQPVAQCACGKPPAGATGAAGTPSVAGRGAARSAVVRVSRETKGRAGKTVTLVRGLPLAADALAALGKRLRAACGAGGTVRDGVIELQGDHAERVLALLVAEGWQARRAGG